MNREPAAIVAAITAVVTAVLGLVVAFGAPVSEVQQGAILTVVAAVAPVVVGLVVRQQVTAPANVVALKTREGRTVAGRAADQTTGAPVEVDEADPEPRHEA